MLKISLLFKKFTNLTGKLLENSYDCERMRNFLIIFYMNANIWGDLQFYISVPLIVRARLSKVYFILIFKD